jgi:two-component system, LuxR family, sensor kinase FixL
LATRHEVQQECLALNPVVHDVLMFLGPELRRQSIATVLELEPNLPEILADRVQLQQVIANIAINVVQAMDGRDERRLTIRTTLQDPGTTCVEIADNGPGIPPEQFPRLFQSFFTTKRGGMGIGLAMCRSIIEAHGGGIEAANLAGGGACFRFTLPVGASFG